MKRRKLDPADEKKYYEGMNRAKDWFRQAQNDLL